MSRLAAVNTLSFSSFSNTLDDFSLFIGVEVTLRFLSHTIITY